MIDSTNTTDTSHRLTLPDNVRCGVGIDVGATSITAAIVLEGVATPVLIEGFGSLAAPGHRNVQLLVSPYRRTRGRPAHAASDMFETIFSWIDPEHVSCVMLTGSGAAAASSAIDARLVNEFRSAAAGLALLGVQARTVFEMGGESSKYLRLNATDDGYGIIDYATNGDCAAGTGSFIDQQCNRLQYDVETISDIVDDAPRAAQIAGRCSVFAKSDMIHAQQKGYTPAEVLRGLCEAVARNFRSAVVRSHPVETPVAFIGGVTANRAVVHAMRDIFDLDVNDLVIPPSPAHVPAIGAASLALRETGHLTTDAVQVHTHTAEFPRSEPLTMDKVTLLRDKLAWYEHDASPLDGYLGIDIGSVSTNLVVLSPEGRVLTEIYTRTQGRPIQVVADGLKQIEAEWGDRLTIRGVGTTGSGRELIGELIGADTVNDEITAHKTGATFIGQTLLDGRIPDTIFEIGGQDSKYICLEAGVVVDFTMNEACAAGTGSFLEERAEELDISIKGEFASRALASEAPIRLGERCTVFMERDVNSYLHRGADKGDLVAGLAYSVVQNYINRVVRGRKIGDTIFFQGGTAYNDAVAAAFAAVTDKEIIVPPHNGVMGAIGAGLLARDVMTTREEPTNFRGYDLDQVDYDLREFTCKSCSNACQIQEFTVEGEKTHWGDKCSDRFRKRAKSQHAPVLDDLFALRDEWMLERSPDSPPPTRSHTVGIPLTMFAYQSLPFWRTMMEHLGLTPVFSEPTNKRIVQAGLDAVVAEPCFPIIAAHGHVADLVDKQVDTVLLPNIVSIDAGDPNNKSHLCPWNQTLPFVVRRAPVLNGLQNRPVFTPAVRFHEGRDAAADQLANYFIDFGFSRQSVKHAAFAGFQAQDRFELRMQHAGSEALAKLEDERKPGIILLGRPYNVYDAGMNLSVAHKLRDQYGCNCLPMDCLPLEGVDIRSANPNMYWALGKRILQAAKFTADKPHLHLIYITNFKCGPDSYIKHFVKVACGKPLLTLQFDGHSNDAGMMTRCEAYLDSKGFLTDRIPLTSQVGV